MLAQIDSQHHQVIYLPTADDDEKLILVWLQSKKLSTRKTYSYNIEDYLNFVNTPIRDTKIEHIINYYNYLDSHHTLNTVRTKLGTVKSLFTFALKTGYIETNPTNMISIGKGTNAINQRFVPEDMLIEIIQKNRSSKKIKATVLSILLYKTGLRISEAIQLRWSDFSRCANGNYVITIFGKGEQQRVIAIDGQFYQWLEELKKDSPFVFTGVKGDHLKRTQAYKLVKEFFAEIPELSPHWLRHCHSIHSLDNGVKIDDLRKSLGHSSLVMTTRYLDARPHQSSSDFIKI